MDQEQYGGLKSLPPQAQREVIDFIAFLRRRYQTIGTVGQVEIKVSR